MRWAIVASSGSCGAMAVSTRPMRSASLRSGVSHLLLHLLADHLVPALEHSPAAQMIQGPVLGGRHQPGAGFFWNACLRPPPNRASGVKSSASGTSRNILAKLVIRRGCSIRQTARIARWASAAVLSADGVKGTLASRAGERAKLARPFPTRHEVLVELHEFPRRRHGLLLARQLENCVAADDLLGHERTIEDTELTVR